MKQYGTLDDTFYMWFGANDTSGSGGDGASPAADVRLAGAAADAAPIYSPTPSLLSHVNYPAGAYEIAITASVANGFATGNTYAVFCTLAIDSQNPTGFVGSFDLKPVESNPTQIGDSAQSLTDLKDFADAGYDPNTNKVTGTADMRGTDSAYTGTPPTTAAIRTEMEGVGTKLTNVLGDTNELQTNQGNWLTATGFSVPNEYDIVIAALQTDLDNPSQYMANISALALEATLTDIKGTGFVKDTHSLPQCLTATGFSVPNEYDTVIAALQTDLDNPTQYKADVSALATALALTTAQSDLDTITGADGVTLATLQALYAPNKVVPDVAGTAAGLHTTTDGKVDSIQTDTTLIKAKTDSLPSGIAKNVALPKFDFLMVLSSDGTTGATGKTVTGEIMKDGGSFAAITNSITEVSGGMYAILSGFTQAEMNAGVITLKFSAADCLDTVITVHTT